MAKAVFCIVNASQAASVVDRLKAAAFSNSDISVLMPNKSARKTLPSITLPRLLKVLPRVPEQAPSWAADSAGSPESARWRSQAWARSLLQVQSWPRLPVLQLVEPSADSPARWSAWASPNTKPSVTRAKSRAATLSSPSTRRTPPRPTAQKQSSKRPVEKISQRPAKPPSAAAHK